MHSPLRWTAIALSVSLPLTAASVQAGKPEDVGLSAERLQQIHETIKRHISCDISGAFILFALRFRISYLEVHGLMDIDSKKPMQRRMPSSASPP
jgi:hypothetical protein